MLPSYLREQPDGCQITVRALPRASRAGVDGERDGALVVRVGAPPVEGAANRAVLNELAGALGVPPRALVLVSGERSRTKSIRVAGLSAADAARRLGATPPRSGHQGSS